MHPPTLGLVLGVLVCGFVGWRVRRRGGRARKAGVLLWGIAALLVPAACYSLWYHHRAQPEPTRETLFRGVVYVRDVRQTPRPMVIHVVTIDLDAPGIGFLVTPGEPTGGRMLPARTTSEFLEEFGVQIAINGSFFLPWHSYGPFNYYPHSGDPVDVRGLAISQGEQYSDRYSGFATLFLSRDNRASISDPLERSWNAISGGTLILIEGEIQPELGMPAFDDPSPRTAVALDKAGRRLLLAVVDGRQPNYSEGARLTELAQICLDHGGYTALNMDGGGSSTLVVEGPDGRPRVLNTPIHGRVPPGVERPVANHLGVFADKQ